MKTRTWIAIIAASVAGGRTRHVVRSSRRSRRRARCPFQPNPSPPARPTSSPSSAPWATTTRPRPRPTQPAILRTLISEAGGDLRTRPEPSEWSVVELIGHIVDAELNSSVRYRSILAEDEPDLVPYDQDLWANRLHSTSDDVDELLATFDALRAANLALWAATPAADRARVGNHLERGPESYELTFRLLAGHDRVHVAQARAGLARNPESPNLICS